MTQNHKKCSMQTSNIIAKSLWMWCVFNNRHYVLYKPRIVEGFFLAEIEMRKSVATRTRTPAYNACPGCPNRMSLYTHTRCTESSHIPWRFLRLSVSGCGLPGVHSRSRTTHRGCVPSIGRQVLRRPNTYNRSENLPHKLYFISYTATTILMAPQFQTIIIRDHHSCGKEGPLRYFYVTRKKEEEREIISPSNSIDLEGKR